MNLFELIDKLKALKTAAQAGDIVGVLDTAGDLAKLAAVLVGGFSAADEPTDFAGVDEAVADLEASCGGYAAAGETKAIDPATILTILLLVKTVVELIRKRRQG